MSDFELYGDEFKPAKPELARSELEKLVPRRFVEFVCFLQQHQNGYGKDTSFKPYDDLLRLDACDARERGSNQPIGWLHIGRDAEKPITGFAG